MLSLRSGSQLAGRECVTSFDRAWERTAKHCRGGLQPLYPPLQGFEQNMSGSSPHRRPWHSRIRNPGPLKTAIRASKAQDSPSHEPVEKDRETRLTVKA